MVNPSNIIPELEFGKWLMTKIWSIPKVIIITYGDNVDVAESLCMEHKIDAYVVNARFLKPMDTDMLDLLGSYNLPIIIYETDIKNGALNMYICSYYVQQKEKLL